MSHTNARLTVHGRRPLVGRIRLRGRPVAHLAAEMGVSRQCAHRWVKRFDAEGWAGPAAGSRRPGRIANRTPAAKEAAVLAERRQSRAGRDEVARRTGVPARSVSVIPARHEQPPLADLDPVTGAVIRAPRATARRYERDRPDIAALTEQSSSIMQPPMWAGLATRAASAPARWLQRLNSSNGTGLVLIARARS